MVSTLLVQMHILSMFLLYRDCRHYYDIQTVNLTMSPLSCACTVFEFSISRGLQTVLNKTEAGGFSKVLGFQYILYVTIYPGVKACY